MVCRCLVAAVWYLVAGAWGAPPCSRPVSRPPGVILVYTFGNNPRTCTSFFVRSFASLPQSATKLIILHESDSRPCSGEAAAVAMAGERIQFVQMDRTLVNKWSKLAIGAWPQSYRYIAFHWWLTLPSTVALGYRYVGLMDTDAVFQTDPFDIMHSFVEYDSEIHLVPESMNNSDYTTRKLTKVTSHPRARDRRLRRFECHWRTQPPRTPALLEAQRNDGNVTAIVQRFWALMGGTTCLNMGTIFGTYVGMVHLFDEVGKILLAGGHGCYDQGIFNVLVYTGALKVDRLVRWNHNHGPFRTLEFGTLRDSYGRFVNERGAPYATVHQFKPYINLELFKEFTAMFPPNASGWQTKIFAEPLQRVPVLKFTGPQSLEKLPAPFDNVPKGWGRSASKLLRLGIALPCDPRNPLPPAPAPCTPPADLYKVSSVLVANPAKVGADWVDMARENFLWRLGHSPDP